MNDEARNLLLRGAAEMGAELTGSQFGQFNVFGDELKKWNRKINLTAIKTDEDIACKHFLDSLALVRTLDGKGHLLDLGSGGGFPAIPIKIFFDQMHVVSVDAVEKKVIFQRHVARLLNLDKFEALHARGEELVHQYADHFDWVVSRAFADIPTFIQMALPLLKPGGTIIAMKGRDGAEEAKAAGASVVAIGLEISEVQEFKLPIRGEARSLLLMTRKP